MRFLGQRRFGTFSILQGTFDEWPHMVRGLLARCVVVRCEHVFASNAFAYTAWSEDFAEVPPGQRPPEYGVNVDLSRQEMWFVPAETKTG